MMTSKPGTKRLKNAFFLHASNVLGLYEVNVGYKNTKGDIHPLTASKQNAKVKISFGPPTSCVLQERKVGEEVWKEYKFQNSRKQSVALRDSILNNLEFAINDFSRKITAMVVENKKQLLACYLSLINSVEGFVHHKDGIHGVEGFLLEEGGVQVQDLTEAGGSLDEFKQFVKLAQESAVMIESSDKAVDEIAKNVQTSKKRKTVVGPAKPSKLSKADAVVANEEKEIKAADGLEEAYKNSFVGIAHVVIDNISVSTEMQVKVNPFRVQFIVSSMRKRYNPATSVMVVCPVEDGSTNDSSNVNKQKYFVVQKVHCLKAFNELDKTGEFVKMSGHQNRKCLCYIINTTQPELMQYGNVRENFITGQFARKTTPQDLLHTFQSLTMKDSSVKSLKVVERMARLCCIGPDECTALEKICQWSSVGFAALMEVLEKFEMYGTEDVKKAGNQQRLARGEKLNLSNVLLRLLAKCSEPYFLDNYQQVLNNSISLKTLAENFKLVSEVKKVYAVLCIMVDERVETVMEKYPGKFEFGQMKPYIGAVCSGKDRNMKAVLLQNYYDSVLSVPEEEAIRPVEFVTYEAIEKVFEEHNIMNKFDMVVLQMKKLNKDICMDILGAIIGGDKVFHAAVIVFPSELDHFDVLSFLRSQQPATSLIKDFKVVPLLFNIDAKSDVEICQNVKYALLFGKMNVLKAPLLIHYSDLVQLANVVDSVCPPQLNIALVSDPGVPGVKLHNMGLDKNITYYGAEPDITKFRKKLDADKAPVTIESDDMETPSDELKLSDQEMIAPQDMLQSDEEEAASGTECIASTSPLKSTPESFNDSGCSGLFDQSVGSISLLAEAGE